MEMIPELAYEITALFEDQAGSIWIGTQEEGIITYHPQQIFFDHFQKEDHLSSSLTNNTVMSILKDHNDYLWVGTYGGGINI